MTDTDFLPDNGLGNEPENKLENGFRNEQSFERSQSFERGQDCESGQDGESAGGDSAGFPDSVLDDIQSVLESDAEEYVNNFVQKGGQ